MATSNPKDPNNNKMKGLLKGLRYISQIFDDNKDQDMQIGYPTDVKHVAHIGWDGPSTANSPSWMNEFQGPPGTASAPLSQSGGKEDHGVKWVSEDTSRKSAKGSKSPALDMVEVSRASRRHSSSGNGGSGGGGGGGGPDSPKREKSDKSKQTRRSSKTRESDKGIRQATDSSQGSESSQNLPEVPKKTRRKKSKESSIGGSSRKIKTLGSSETYSDQPGTRKSFQEGEDKGFT